MPATPTMGPAPVFVCSSKLDKNIKVQFNSASFGSDPVTSNTSFVQLDSFTEENNTVKCSFKLNSKFSVNNQTSDLNMDTYAVIAAVGNVTDDGNILHHDKTFKSSKLYTFGDNNPFNPAHDYDECGLSHDCLGMPDNCLTGQNCTFLAKWTQPDHSTVMFNLIGNVNSTDYLAIALSIDNMMGGDSVVACLANGNTSLFWNTENPWDSLPVVATSRPLNAVQSSYADNKLVCRFNLSAEYNVTDPSSNKSFDFNLNNLPYYILLAQGPYNENNKIGHHTQKLASSKVYFGQGNIYANCNGSSECFGMPENCIDNQNCTLLAKWQSGSDSFNIKMYGEADETNYIAMGLSQDNLMGKDSVFACLGNGNTSLFWNTDHPWDSLPVADQSPLVAIKSNIADGILSCEFNVSTTYNSIDPNSNTSSSFDLNNTPYYILLASGPYNKSINKIEHHTSKAVSPNTFFGKDDYEGCKESHGCFGMPDNCVSNKNCTLLSKWRKGNNSYTFTIVGTATESNYLAQGLSYDDKMGDDSVVACLGSGKVAMFWNTANPHDSIPTNDTTSFTAGSTIAEDGKLRCSFNLTSNYNVIDPTTNQTNMFDLDNHKYFALLALGSMKGDTQLNYHSSRTSSPTVINFADNKPTQPDLDYTGCNDAYGCAGMPDYWSGNRDCIATKDCWMLMKWKGVSAQSYEIELSATVNETSQYIALGFSWDDKMGNDSVIACLGNGQVSEYWNKGDVDSLPVDESSSVLLQSNSTYVDGTLICSFTITYLFSMKSPLDNNSYTFDLNHDKYYALFAVGPYDENNLLQKHVSKHKFATVESIDYSVFNDYISSDIYDSCYETKGCFGSESDCIRDKNCKIMTTYKKVSPEEYEFEIGFHSTSGSGYAAIALSDDDKMGDDSVMACIIDKDVTDINMYWNTESYNSVPLLDKHLGLSNISKSYANGYAVCTFRRKAITQIPDDNQNLIEFDINNSSYYLLLALGNIDSEGIIQHHDTTSKTSDSINLGTYGPIKNSSALFVKLHGIAMTMAWMFFANIGVFIARFYKKHFQVIAFIRKFTTGYFAK